MFLFRTTSTPPSLTVRTTPLYRDHQGEMEAPNLPVAGGRGGELLRVVRVDLHQPVVHVQVHLLAAGEPQNPAVPAWPAVEGSG